MPPVCGFVSATAQHILPAARAAAPVLIALWRAFMHHALDVRLRRRAGLHGCLPRYRATFCLSCNAYDKNACGVTIGLRRHVPARRCFSGWRHGWRWRGNIAAADGGVAHHSTLSVGGIGGKSRIHLTCFALYGGSEPILLTAVPAPISETSTTHISVLRVEIIRIILFAMVRQFMVYQFGMGEKTLPKGIRC